MAANDEKWVFSEKAKLLAELIAGAQEIKQPGGPVVALVLGAREQAEQALASGAQRVIWLGEIKPGCLVDDYLPTLAQLVSTQRPGMVIIGSTKRGRALAGRLGARLGVSALTDVLRFIDDPGGLRAVHLIFGGGAVRTDKFDGQTILATVGPGVFQARPSETGHGGQITEAAFVEPDWRVSLVERKLRPVVSTHLPAARKVVCAGRGLASQDDLKLVTELAQVLGAELACTRPLAEGLDWLPRERYIGISGAVVKPELYLGVGVSGQVQHVIGMSGSRVVVAINKDSSAPIFSQADYGIADNLYTVLPALIQALKARA